MKKYYLQVITGNNSSNSGTYTTLCKADYYKLKGIEAPVKKVIETTSIRRLK
jgi:hypothetical protein